MRSGPYSPQSANESRQAGESVWQNPNNILASDNTRAQAMLMYPGSQQSGKLNAMNPGSTEIPDAAAVTQVLVNVERSAGNSGGSPKDLRASLIIGGVLQADNQAKAAVWPTSDSVVTYTFNVSLTGAQVKAADFGFSLSAITAGAKYQNVVRVDSVTFEFEY